MIALPVLPTPATTGTRERDTPLAVAIADRRRIGELDADYTRLHRAMARSLTQSLRTYAGELKAGTPAHIAAKAFVQRQTHLLSTAYDLAHYEGQRDYHETVSARPREMPLVEPDATLKARRLAFYLPSVTKMAREGAEAQRERRLSPVTARLDEPNTNIISERLTLATVPTGDALDDWLDGLGVRVDLQAGIAWPGLQDGYVKGGAADNANPFSLVYWVLEPLAQHCHDCPAFAAASPYNAPGSGGNELWIAPGDGTSECGAGCRCSLSYEPDTSDEAIAQASAQQAYQQWLPQNMPESFAGEGGREVLLKTFAPRLGAQPGPLLDGQKRALDALRGAMADWDTVRGAYPSAPNFFAGTLGAENATYSIPVDWARLTKPQQRVILRVLAALDAWDFWTQEAWLNAPDEGGQGDVGLAEDAADDGGRITLSNPYPRGPHGHFGEGGEHGMHGSHVGAGRHGGGRQGEHEVHGRAGAAMAHTVRHTTGVRPVVPREGPETRLVRARAEHVQAKAAYEQAQEHVNARIRSLQQRLRAAGGNPYAAFQHPDVQAAIAGRRLPAFERLNAAEQTLHRAEQDVRVARQGGKRVDEYGRPMPFSLQEAHDAWRSGRALDNNNINVTAIVHLGGRDWVMKHAEDRDAATAKEQQQAEAATVAGMKALGYGHLAPTEAYHVVLGDTHYSIISHEPGDASRNTYSWLANLVPAHQLHESWVGEYLMGMKDRHPGNVLLNTHGASGEPEVRHIDFGFGLKRNAMVEGRSWARKAIELQNHGGAAFIPHETIRRAVAHEAEVLRALKPYHLSKGRIAGVKARFKALRDALDANDPQYGVSVNALASRHGEAPIYAIGSATGEE